MVGIWRGKVGGQLEIILSFQAPPKAGEIWSGTFDVPVQNMKGIGLDKFEFADDSLKFALHGEPGNARYEGNLHKSGDTMTGRYEQGPVDVEVELKKGAVKMSAVDTKSINAVAEKLFADWKAPGLALAVAKDGKIAHAAGYGFKNVDKKEPMTADTLLAIGSCTKAFTTAVIALPVEQGVLDLDRPAHQY